MGARHTVRCLIGTLVSQFHDLNLAQVITHYTSSDIVFLLYTDFCHLFYAPTPRFL
jgi:hypothetical protein